MSGFIDPTAPARERQDRLEALITEALAIMDIRSAMSPEARAIYDDLTSENEVRRERARRIIAAKIDEHVALDDDAATGLDFDNPVDDDGGRVALGIEARRTADTTEAGHVSHYSGPMHPGAREDCRVCPPADTTPEGEQ